MCAMRELALSTSFATGVDISAPLGLVKLCMDSLLQARDPSRGRECNVELFAAMMAIRTALR